MRVGPHEFLVREAGPASAPAVLLIHGWALDSPATWHRVWPLLRGGLRLIAVDLRGHGKSDRVRERFDIEDLADDLAACLDVLGVGTFSVVGYSLGGMVAQALARRHPARVERLVLAATAAAPLPYPRPVGAALMLAARALGRLDPALVPRVMHSYLLRTGALAPEHSAWMWEVLMSRDVDLHHEAGFAMARFDARPWVGRLRLPVLCLITTRDQLIPVRHQRALAALLPGAKVVEIDARHEAVFTQAGRVAEEIVGFVLSPAGEPG